MRTDRRPSTTRYGVVTAHDPGSESLTVGVQQDTTPSSPSIECDTTGTEPAGLPPARS